MLCLLAAVTMMAAPGVGSHWTWTYEETLAIKKISGPRGVQLSAPSQLGKAVMALTVDEVGPDGPRRMTLSMSKGPKSLRGRTWDVETNYGEVVLTDKLKSPGPSEELAVLRKTAGLLVKSDPILGAAASGAPCDEGTLKKVAEATALLVKNVGSADSQTTAVKDATAECQGKGGRYAVRFTLEYFVSEQVITLPWKGTVEATPNLWRAHCDLRASTRSSFITGKGKLVYDQAMTFRSQLKQ